MSQPQRHLAAHRDGILQHIAPAVAAGQLLALAVAAASQLQTVCQIACLEPSQHVSLPSPSPGSCAYGSLLCCKYCPCAASTGLSMTVPSLC